jgi:ABC-2 type transport system permease protein
VTNSLCHVTLAELGKLRTLPAVAITIACTVLGTMGCTVAFAAAFAQPVPHAVRYGQCGLILLGVLAAATEYSGHQIRTTLACVPGRLLLLTGKTIAYLTAATLTALTTVLTSGFAAHGTLDVAVTEFGYLLGATGDLVLIGLLAFAVAVLTRSLVGALVTMLTLVFAVSPLLATMTPLARYLPGQTAGWTVLVLAAAAVTFTKRDA